MTSETDRRLSEGNVMIPALIEENFIAEDGDGQDQFLAKVSSLVRSLTDIRVPLSAGLIKQLLQHQRIIVIIDGLSELGEQTRDAVLAAIVNVPVNATVITSRSDMLPKSWDKSVIKPQRINKGQLLSFIVTYLQGRDQAHVDKEFIMKIHDPLSNIVGDRDITALLAKLYIELILSEGHRPAGDNLPGNIPDLMLEYVKTIYGQSAITECSLGEILSAAQVLAWKCVKRGYRPMPVKRAEVQNSLGPRDKGPVLLKHLEERLKLIQLSGADQTRIRFTLDPLAEYLAGLYLVSHFSGDETSWREFLDRAAGQQGTPASSKDFLVAVKDCCLARADEYVIPTFVVEELVRLIGE